MQVGTKKLPMVVWPIRACNKFNREVGIMKKLISVLCAVVMMAVFAVPAFAATSKSDIISEIKAGVKVGDKVITSKYSGTEVKVDGEEYTIVRQGDILAIVE